MYDKTTMVTDVKQTHAHVHPIGNTENTVSVLGKRDQDIMKMLLLSWPINKEAINFVYILNNVQGRIF